MDDSPTPDLPDGVSDGVSHETQETNWIPIAPPPEPPLRAVPDLYCEICDGVLVPHDGSVTHLLLRLVREPNPHDGWWHDQPAGPRFICDACYAEHIHPVFGYGAPEYVPKDRAVRPHAHASETEDDP